jgi:transcriptional regulator with XRE-family HTH domain
VLLGAQIATARLERKWKAADLAAKVGISLPTLRGVEQGAPTVGIGIVFELATIVGIPLFDMSPAELREVRARTSDRLALIPQRVHDQTDASDDDF